jgi:cardiolipin synthase A/B
MGAHVDACLVLGNQHGHYVREARDHTARRIFVTSHRLGTAAKQAVIIPAIAAARDRNSIEARLFFGRPTGEMTGRDAAEITYDAGKDGVVLRPVYKPRLHSKVLAWDDDFAVVTSQNWLSADPGYASPLEEVGVYLKGARVADAFIAVFLNAQGSEASS